MPYLVDDEKKFEALYLEYYPRLMVYGSIIADNEGVIEDTIQELFAELWRKKEGLLIKSSLDAYLFVSFRNNLIKKAKKQAFVELDFDLADESFDPLPPEDSASEKELRRWIVKLPPSQREVLYLRYYENMSYLEISEMLEINYQVARNFSYRALKFLKKKMKSLQVVLFSIAF